MKKSTVLGFVFAALTSAVFSGCGGGNGTVASNVSAPRRFGSLEFTLTTTKATFAHGEPVPLTFTVKNIGLQPEDANRTSCQWFDTKVLNGSQVIWQESGTHGCASVIIPVSIAPGETKTYMYNWPQTDQQTVQVPPGQCILKSWLELNNPTDLPQANEEANEAANTVQITVQ